MPNVVLTLADESRRAKYEVRSGDSGQFEFVGLPSGQYLFTVAGPGFRPSSARMCGRHTGGRIVPPLKIRDVRPEYPSLLRGTGTVGVGVLNTTIGADGYVSDVDVAGEAHPELAAAAIAAVRDWRFTHTLLNCVPVPVSMTVTVTFGRK